RKRIKSTCQGISSTKRLLCHCLLITIAGSLLSRRERTRIVGDRSVGTSFERGWQIFVQGLGRHFLLVGSAAGLLGGGEFARIVGDRSVGTGLERGWQVLVQGLGGH